MYSNVSQPFSSLPPNNPFKILLSYHSPMKLIKDMLYIYSAYVYLCFTPKKLYQQRIKDYGFLSPLSAILPL